MKLKHVFILMALVTGLAMVCFSEGNGVGSGGAPPPKSVAYDVLEIGQSVPICNGRVVARKCRRIRNRDNFRACCFRECDKACGEANPFEDNRATECLRSCISRY